jgi:vitamin B12 transporter
MKTYLITLLLLGTATPAIAQTTATTTLASDAARSNDIVVTATRSGDAIPTDLIGSSVTVIGYQDLQDRQTRVLSDVLRDVPGVAVNRSGAIGDLTQVRIRGSEGNQVLVFVDGIKADDPYYGEYDFGTLLNDDASRVEVLRGQQSALYGSDAIGGVISYTTLSGRELPGASLRVEGGSMGTYDGSARVAGASGNFDYAVSSSYYHTDGYPIAPGGRLDTGSNSLGVSGKFNWTPAPDLKLTAVGRYSYTRAESDDQQIAANSPVVMGYPVVTTVDTPGNYNTNRGYYGLLGAEWSLFENVLTTSVQATIADTTRNGYDFSTLGYGDHGRRYRGSFTSTVHFDNEHFKNRFTLAVDAERQDFRNTSPGGYSNDDSHRIDQLGFVTQYDLTFDDRLAISASARIDTSTRFSDDATYRATASYLFPGGTRIHGAYGTGVKDPSATELFDYVTGQYVGNPNLKPEQSQGWEAGLEQSLLDSHVKLGATYFDSRFTNEIDTTYTLVGGNYLQTPFNNPIRFNQRGVETYAAVRTGNLRFSLAYTYLHSPQTIMALTQSAAVGGTYQLPATVPIQAVRRPSNIASFNATWAPKAWPVSATLTVRYNGKQNDYAFNSVYNRLIVNLKAYTLVNLNAAYDIDQHVQVFGRVENLLDQKYQEVFTFATPGRAAYGGVRLKL